MLSDLQLVYMVPRNSTQLLNINTTKFQVEREPVYIICNCFFLTIMTTHRYKLLPNVLHILTYMSVFNLLLLGTLDNRHCA